MDICLNTLSYLNYLPLERVIHHVAKLGFDTMEVIGQRPHGWPDDYDGNARRTLIKICKDNNIQVSSLSVSPCYFMQTGLADRNAERRKESGRYIRNLIQFTNDLGGEFTVIVPGRLLYGEDFRESWNNIVIEIQELCDFASDIGITLAIENMLAPCEFSNTPDRLAQLVGDVRRRNVGVALDVGHLNATKAPLSAFLAKLRDSVVNIHISDNYGFDDTHGPVGSGTVDFSKIFEELRRAGYERLITLEISSNWRWSIDDVDRAIIDSRNAINKVIDSLDKQISND